jgi:ATP-binding cassette subfamily B protein
VTDYTLRTNEAEARGRSFRSAVRSLAPLLRTERANMIIAGICVLLSAAATLLTPVIIARAVDTAITEGDVDRLLVFGALLAAVFVAGFAIGYVQTVRMGTVGRNVLFHLRNRLFTQISSLPVAFFAQNRAGDLISRVNGDTEKLNQFFANAMSQMIGGSVQVVGAGILLLALDWRMGLVALIPAAVIFVITRAISPWVKRTNHHSLETMGALSGDIAENLSNFQVIVAFNRVDYFSKRFNEANTRNYRAARMSGIAAGLFVPLFTAGGSLGAMSVLAFGFWLVAQGELTIGLLIGYLLYVTAFYNPLRQLAMVWSTLQQALAAMDRISEMLRLKSDLALLARTPERGPPALLAFEHVGFAYPGGKHVLDDVSLELERGRTYALVGPTGGGKTTTASLMARLYDPTSGTVYLDGCDIRTYSAAERAARIGFILQEPFLLGGTVRDNIIYGHPQLAELDKAELDRHVEELGLAPFLSRFANGLDSEVGREGDGLSLGQKQLVAFVRAVLREPDILILDEATANIDTVTEQLLERVLAKLPPTTTKVVIAHRLNTIKNADDIFFVGGGSLTEAGSMEHALDMLLTKARAS